MLNLNAAAAAAADDDDDEFVKLKILPKICFYSKLTN